MQTFFAILASAALATAAAVAGGESGAPKMGGATCAAGNTVACCDTSGGDGVLGNLLGGSCIIPNLLSISNNCPSGNTFCCPVNSDGQLNIAAACIPISL